MQEKLEKYYVKMFSFLWQVLLPKPADHGNVDAKWDNIISEVTFFMHLSFPDIYVCSKFFLKEKKNVLITLIAPFVFALHTLDLETYSVPFINNQKYPV